MLALLLVPASIAGQRRVRRLPVLVQVPTLDVGADTLAARAKAQRDTVDQFKVDHDFRFTDRLPESGITFVHHIVDDAGKHYKAAHYDHGNGIAVADVDGDGLPDIYFVSQVGGNELWKNLGDGKFKNITAAAGVGVPGKVSVSASFADIDNDGDQDLYVTTVRGGNMLFENDGHGHFKDITAASGLNYVGHSSGAVFFDYDRDGRLDLFLVNVGKYTTNNRQRPGGYYVGLPDAFKGHMFPERTGEKRFSTGTRATAVRRRHRGRWGCATLVERRRDVLRRQRRRLARSLRAEHAGRRPLLRERRRQALRRQDGPVLSQDLGAPWGSSSSTSTTTAVRISSSPTCTRT